MYLYQINDNCQVVCLSLKNPPTPNKDGSLLVTCGDILTVRANTYHEAVDDGGRVLGTGKYFNVHGDKEMRLTFQPVLSGKTFSAAQIKEARRETRETVVCQEAYGGGPFIFDGALKDVVASLEGIMRGIPAQHRAGATCRITSESGYEDSHYASITVSYNRPETDEEVTARLEDEAIARMLAEQGERAQLDQLKAKYG